MQSVGVVHEILTWYDQVMYILDIIISNAVSKLKQQSPSEENIWHEHYIT